MNLGAMGATRRGGFGSGGALGGAGGSPVVPGVLSAGKGSFILTGDAMSPLVDRKLPSDLGTFALTGQAATLTATTSYQGPGDIVSGATGWWGLRAYTAASIGANCVELRRSTDNTAQTFVTIAGGGLDLAAITTFASGGNLFVRTLYDQTGGGHNMTQTTNASQPDFILGGLGSLPIMRATIAAGKFLAATLAANVSQPFTASLVSHRQADTTTAGFLGGSISPVAFWQYNNTVNTLAVLGPTTQTTTVSDAAFHALNLVFNGASSDMNIDGTANAKSVGTNALGTSVGIFATPGQGSATAEITEHGIWPSAFNGTQSSNMSSNQHSYWGF